VLPTARPADPVPSVPFGFGPRLMIVGMATIGAQAPPDTLHPRVGLPPLMSSDI